MQIVLLSHLKCIWQCNRGLANKNSFSEVSLIIFLLTWRDVGNLTHHGQKRKTPCFRLKKKKKKKAIPNIK